MIEYKAHLHGLEVFPINPYMTSQDCSRCHKRGTRDKKSFECQHCRHSDTADFKASFNIAQKVRGEYILVDLGWMLRRNVMITFSSTVSTVMGTTTTTHRGIVSRRRGSSKTIKNPSLYELGFSYVAVLIFLFSFYIFVYLNEGRQY